MAHTSKGMKPKVSAADTSDVLEGLIQGISSITLHHRLDVSAHPDSDARAVALLRSISGIETHKSDDDSMDKSKWKPIPSVFSEAHEHHSIPDSTEPTLEERSEHIPSSGNASADTTRSKGLDARHVPHQQVVVATCNANLDKKSLDLVTSIANLSLEERESSTRVSLQGDLKTEFPKDHPPHDVRPKHKTRWDVRPEHAQPVGREEPSKSPAVAGLQDLPEVEVEASCLPGPSRSKRATRWDVRPDCANSNGEKKPVQSSTAARSSQEQLGKKTSENSPPATSQPTRATWLDIRPDYAYSTESYESAQSTTVSSSQDEPETGASDTPFSAVRPKRATRWDVRPACAHPELTKSSSTAAISRDPKTETSSNGPPTSAGSKHITRPHVRPGCANDTERASRNTRPPLSERGNASNEICRAAVASPADVAVEKRGNTSASVALKDEPESALSETSGHGAGKPAHRTRWDIRPDSYGDPSRKSSPVAVTALSGGENMRHGLQEPDTYRTMIHL
ncbi:hypothetical protein OBBRIDRAFT_410036 [Obba rivulosa]|uniref:Uncharacterized protein n=1 Tax=Obba rivulosa TaxID=1052685 RepID=A0A8E2B103_9APHY|nr:hypothetical protein OBBRIDRAFT_410036 [Obba rivulosa]